MVSSLAFFVRARQRGIPASPRPCLVLTTDNWDDFGRKVQFHLSYVAKTGSETRIGAVKVLQKTSLDGKRIEIAERTLLPEKFTTLTDAFISLGQEDDYYKELYRLLGSQSSDVLDALRDIARHPGFAEDFEPTSAFRNAMMRENGAHRARRFGAMWAAGQPTSEKLAFTYLGAIAGAASDVKINFAFQRNDPVPGRIIGIIGRNAVGKTQFLASLGADLAQLSRTSAERLQEREKRFPEDARPLFTRIIAISYSAFDRFVRPSAKSTSSYVYCGIRNEKGALSRASLVEAYRRNQQRIRDRGVQSDWTRHMQTILGDLSEQLTASLQAEINSDSSPSEPLSFLSSGQSILAHFVTALLAWIQPNSLVLFDEPETHLHPNAVASLFLVLSDILSEFDSYAVVATHSPVVIQEIPSKRVFVFQREGDVTTAQPLELESFGESVTELTKHVFETVEVESVYRRTLKQLAEEESLEEVMQRFKLGLSLNAQAYLLAQYGKKQGAQR